MYAYLLFEKSSKLHYIKTLTLVPLISNNDEKSDACAKTIQSYCNWADVACCTTTTSKYNILIGGAAVYLGTVNQNNHRHQYEHSQNLHTRNTNYLISIASLNILESHRAQKLT